MNTFLKLAFLFFIGCTFGWAIEVIYRRFFSKANEIKVWINPGFLQGPYLPLYGSGLCLLYLLAGIENTNLILDVTFGSKTVLFIVMAIVMTILEFVAGLIFIKGMNVRLWDYRKEKGNIMGIICPKFSFYWAILGAIYYFLINPWVNDALAWFKDNLAFSFVVGMFFGIFILDVAYSFSMATRIRRYAREHGIILRYENFRTEILLKAEKRRSELRLVKEEIEEHIPGIIRPMEWLMPFNVDIPLKEHLERYVSIMEAFSEVPDVEEQEKRIGK